MIPSPSCFRFSLHFTLMVLWIPTGFACIQHQHHKTLNSISNGVLFIFSAFHAFHFIKFLLFSLFLHSALNAAGWKKKCILNSILNLSVKFKSLKTTEENERLYGIRTLFFIMRKIHFVCRTLARFDVITQSNAMRFISMLKIS